MRKIHLAVGVVCLLALAGCAPKMNRQGMLLAMRDADAAFRKAVSEKDVQGIVAAYADDASMFPPGLPTITGKEAIRARWAQDVAIPGFRLSWLVRKRDVSSSGDLGFTQGVYVIHLSDPKGQLIIERGKYVVVWQKATDGKWKLVADIWNPDGPAAPAPAKP